MNRLHQLGAGAVKSNFVDLGMAGPTVDHPQGISASALLAVATHTHTCGAPNRVWGGSCLADIRLDPSVRCQKQRRQGMVPPPPPRDADDGGASVQGKKEGRRRRSLRNGASRSRRVRFFFVTTTLVVAHTARVTTAPQFSVQSAAFPALQAR